MRTSARSRLPISVCLAWAAAATLLGGCGGSLAPSEPNDGILSFTAQDYAVLEDGTPNTPIEVQRLGGSGAVSVTVLLTDGTAHAGADYDGTPITVSWAAGDTSTKTVVVPIVDDHVDEPNETVFMRLINPTGGAIIRHPLDTATLTIVDNDVGGSIGFGSGFYLFREDGTALGPQVMVFRTGGMDGTVTATIVSHDGTANSDPMSTNEPVDYAPVSVTVTFGDQDTTPVMIPITIFQDVLPEMDEMFTLEVTNPTGGATVGQISTAMVEILDDDPPLMIPNPGFGGLFGSSIAKLGPLLVVGAPGNGSGAGVVYTIDPSTGSVVDTISRPLSSQFGKSLAVDGSMLAIGGADNVWVLDAGTHLDRFVLSSTASGFGNALLGLGDGRLAIGVPLAPVAGSASSGYVLIHDAVTGAFLQEIDGTAGSETGTALALFAGDLLIGAPGGDGAVLQYGGTPLAQVLVIANPAPEAQSPRFGASLATTDTSLYVGLPDSDVGALNGGGVRLFMNGTSTPVSPTVANARFGTTLLHINDKLCVEAPGQGPQASGRVHVYDQSLFFNYSPIDDPSPSANAGFGAALCEFDGVLVVGAPHQTVSGVTNAGAIFIFRLP